MLPRLIRTSREPVYYSVNDLFRNSYSPYNGTCLPKEKASPAVNISEDENAYFVELAAPGLNKKDLKISIEEDVLQVSYKTKEEEKKENNGFIRKEFSVAPFTKRFLLPETTNQEGVKANFKNGVLKLEVPKIVPEKKPVHEVEIA